MWGQMGDLQSQDCLVWRGVWAGDLQWHLQGAFYKEVPINGPRLGLPPMFASNYRSQHSASLLCLVHISQKCPVWFGAKGRET